MAKLAMILFSGPEMPCKLRHGLLFARDTVDRGGEATLILEGNAPQWLAGLLDEGHKLRRLFDQAQAAGLIGGVCKGCALQFEAVEAAESLGLALLGDAYGHVSLALLAEQGFEIVVL